MKPNSTSAAK